MNERQSGFSRSAGGWIRRVLLLSLIVILFAQASLHIISDIFAISLGMVCLAAFVYFIDDFPLIPVALVSGAGVVLTRALVNMAQGSPSGTALENASPEMIFYVVMGLLLFLFDQLTGHSRRLYVFIPLVILSDYVANALELFSRVGQDSYNLHDQLMLAAVALIRGGILLIVCVSLDRYRVMLLSRSHAERYHRLIMLTSRLKGEVVWMKKNQEQIEETMATAYELYDELLESGRNEEAQKALSVAKDVHEIKKEYLLIGRGIEEAGDEGREFDGMPMTELFTILIRSMKEEFRDSGKSLTILTDSQNALYTSDPYLFLSVFHNLISNSVEAAGKGRNCGVTISERAGDGVYVYRVKDNGPGIPEKYRDKIFEPRFSTKIDYETGSVNRGLGLCIVKDIVEKDLGGTIRLENTRRGASFVFTVPADRMEVIK